MSPNLAMSGSHPELGPWIQTYTGRAFYPLNPGRSDISIADIAHALSMQCRFTGHTRRFYSVAEHSLRVSGLIDRLNGGMEDSHPSALWGLLHDASEAYLVDVPRPIKHMPELAQYRKLEHETMMSVALTFGLSCVEPPEVKEADNIMLAIEARDLMAPLRPGWEQWDSYIALAPQGYHVRYPMTPDQAELAFMARFHTLYVGK